MQGKNCYRAGVTEVSDKDKVTQSSEKGAVQIGLKIVGWLCGGRDLII